MRTPLAVLVLLLAAGCGTDSASPPSRDVNARVADATDRLQASEAGQTVLRAMEAHGGLAAWYGSGPLAFRYAYTRLDSLGNADSSRAPLDTRQLVDTWSSRAVHTLAADTSVSFGWTGQQAWARPSAEAVPTDARFWSLTPYYFVAMPFVLADPGVNLESASPITVDGRQLEQVYVTFDPGTGDAPDDYYYLLVDPQTDRVAGVRYVVSYGPFNPDGGHTPETMMLYDGTQTVGEITLQEGFRSFAWDGDGPGTPKARGQLTEAAFRPDTPASAFAPPTGAEILPEPEL